MLNVTNATDFKSSFKIYGSMSLRILNLLTTRTFERAAICTNKPMVHVRSDAKIGGKMKIGNRQPDDILLRLEKVRVRSDNREFPRHTFEFLDKGVSINEVTITASVSMIYVIMI